MNALSRNMLRALRSYDLDEVLVCDFRTVKALLAAGFITWDSTASAYVPSDAGLQALADHEEAHAPDPEILDILIASAQVEEEPVDDPEPAQPEPVAPATDYGNTDEPDAYTGWDEVEAAPDPLVEVEVVTAEVVEPSDPALLAQMLAPGFTLDRLALPPAQPEPAAQPATSKPKRRRARRAVPA